MESCTFVNKFSPNLNWSGNSDINKVGFLTDYITIPLDIDQIVTKNVFVTRNGTWCEWPHRSHRPGKSLSGTLGGLVAMIKVGLWEQIIFLAIGLKPSITTRNILSYKFANISYNVFVPAWELLCQRQKTWFHREKLRRCSLPHQIPCIRFVAGKDFNWYKWALHSPLSSSMAINIHIISENPSWFWWSKANCHLSKSSLPAPGDGKMGHGEQTFWWEASSWWLLTWK